METQIVIGVPGLWKDRTELIQEVASKSNYMLAGNIMHHKEKEIVFEIDVYEQDTSLGEAFFYASGERFDEELLRELEKHTYTVYVIAKVDDTERLQEVIDVGMELLNAGGLALKVETAGVAYSKEEWKELAEDKEIFPMYSHLVTLVGDEEGGYYSCGMQAFNLPDVVLDGGIDPEVAVDLLNDFNLHNIFEKPNLKDGDTISFTEDSPMYRLAHYIDERYEQEDPFYNPCGVWKLESASAKKSIFQKFGSVLKGWKNT
ncbi:DUF4261 domain-containing protein [Bacillus cereus]|uniref:Endopeptidase n=2 Tax=Bacillus cereus TaxID=1396 RepID=A0A1S9UNV5_BACCE|nr:DUF4261 domain-containing protein [Bacillus cereus]EJQ99843.1 hypothetical protein II3_02794 [Bacillus cereus MC67]EOP14526.1 hypothetical protein II1_02735 [Bacillus cereus MC118]OOR23814.1 endopeptidase [Bacillus cereus]